jgi:hypothetical protein
VTSLTNVTTGAGPVQLSLVVTPAIFGAGTREAHCTVKGAGQVMVGGVLSNTVITWIQVAELPHASVDRYVLLTIYLFTQVWFTVTSLTNNTVGAGPVQLSLVVTPAIFGAGCSDAHCTVTGAGHVIVGGVSSNTVMTWIQVAEFPHASVALYVLLTWKRLTQVWFTVASTTKVITGAGSHASLAVTPVILGAGTNEAHCTVNGAGQVMIGGVISCTAIVLLQVAVLLQSSVAVQVRVTL